MADRQRRLTVRNVARVAVAYALLTPPAVAAQVPGGDDCHSPMTAEVAAPYESRRPLAPAGLGAVKPPERAGRAGEHLCVRHYVLIARADFTTTAEKSRGRTWWGLSLAPAPERSTARLQLCVPVRGRVTARPASPPFAVADFAPEP